MILDLAADYCRGLKSLQWHYWARTSASKEGCFGFGQTDLFDNTNTNALFVDEQLTVVDAPIAAKGRRTKRNRNGGGCRGFFDGFKPTFYQGWLGEARDLSMKAWNDKLWEGADFGPHCGGEMDGLHYRFCVRVARPSHQRLTNRNAHRRRWLHLAIVWYFGA